MFRETLRKGPNKKGGGGRYLELGSKDFFLFEFFSKDSSHVVR